MAEEKQQKASGKKQDIIEEIRDKVDDYEVNFSGFIAEFNDWFDIFTVKKPLRRQNTKTFSNPRSTEMLRAVNALATLELRMMTANDPYFDIAPMDISLDNRKLSIIQSTLETQLDITQHKRYLLKALISKILFGTVIVEEPYQTYGLNPFGRKMAATGFVPRSLLQVAFERNTSDIDNADWLSTADVITKQRLMSLAREDAEGKVWIKSEIDAAIADDSPMPNQNQYIINRLSRSGYDGEQSQKYVRELLIYRGKLDTLNDGIEYVVGLVNRKYLVRFHANNFQHGKRNFRVARWLEVELEPLAYGQGKLLASLHKSIDANRQKYQDSITFDTYSMWLMDRMGGINAQDLKIRPMQIIEADNVNAMKRLESNVGGATLGLKLEDLLKAEFRAASGATDTLQALVTEATASEVSLAQNEALRNISVKAEIAAASLVREHIEVMHANNIQYQNEPFNVNVRGKTTKVYPADLWYDVDFRVKIVTDKDYKPQRLKSLVEMLTVLTSIRNEHPEKYQISIIPIVEEIARSLGVNAEALILPPQPGNQLQALLGQGGATDAPGLPPPEFTGNIPGGLPVVDTPVGAVLASP